MARYKVSLYTGPQHSPNDTLVLIAALVGMPHTALRLKEKIQPGGIVSFEVSTVHDHVAAGIMRLEGVQAVQPVSGT
jgi:hypothetical protein